MILRRIQGRPVSPACDDPGVYGVLLDEQDGGIPVCVSLESRQHMIKPGKYALDVDHKSPKFGSDCVGVQVPGRTHILFHAANYAYQLKGCIAPGLMYWWRRVSTDPGDVDELVGVGHSGAALELLIERIKLAPIGGRYLYVEQSIHDHA